MGFTRSQHHLPPVCEGTAASNRLSVITLTSALAVYKQKLFYHIQAKGGAMFGNFILFTQPLLYLILLQWTFKLFNSSLSVHVNELCSALSCWDLLVGIQACNRFASVVVSVRACTGTEGAASSKFGHANVNDRLNILDTILIYLFLTSFLPMHSMHCPTPCTRHASPTVPPARPMHVSHMH